MYKLMSQGIVQFSLEALTVLWLPYTFLQLKGPCSCRTLPRVLSTMYFQLFSLKILYILYHERTESTPTYGHSGLFCVLHGVIFLYIAYLKWCTCMWAFQLNRPALFPKGLMYHILMCIIAVLDIEGSANAKQICPGIRGPCAFNTAVLKHFVTLFCSDVSVFRYT